IADWHALTTHYRETDEVKENVFNMICDWLAVGIDPQKSVIFRQSDITEHAELFLLLSMIVPLPWLERNPTYKEQLREMEGRDLFTYGFLGYPVLQAADILIYRADTVPVGEDQLPHLELTREIARRFNYFYSPIFPEPQAKLSEVPELVGIDGRKMSKSYGNTIPLDTEEEELRKLVKNMITDPARIRRTDPGHPEVCTVFAYHKIFNKEEIAEIDQACRNAQIGCVECKMKLADKLNEFLTPIREKRKIYSKDKDLTWSILLEGNKKARMEAQKTMELVREVMKIKIS
ncbi:MAG: tryptophan--tRNA ligase, partial [Dictyoglomus sp.]